MIQEGQKIGNYKILSRLGVGGMGTVYLAEHPLIGKKVALKVIHRELATNKEVISRFFNEARAVNRIGNDHIVEIHDFGQSPEGDHFFIMEYLEGRTLAQELAERGPLDVQRSLHIAAQIATGLLAAHDQGIIHRDLKPDNIMLTPRVGEPDFTKVLDFGLAKMFVDNPTAPLTAQGVVLGTPQYMSPEACESRRDIDHRSDIYSLGVLLFQMLTGQVPFDGEAMGAVLVKHVAHPPPAPRAVNPNIPPSVDQIVLRCLAKAPDARFSDMRVLRDALLDPERYLAGSPPVVPSAPVAAPQAKTMFAAAPPPSAVPAQVAAAPSAPQPAVADAGANTVYAVAGEAVAEINQPAVAVNRTMMIDGPAVSPGRRGALLVLIVAFAALIGAGVALLVLSSNGGEESAALHTDKPDASVAETAPVVESIDAAGIDARGPDAASKPKPATVYVTTTPEGAVVEAGDGTVLIAATPGSLTLPRDGKTHELVVKRAGSITQKKPIRTSPSVDEHNIHLELTPKRTRRSEPTRRHRRTKPRRPRRRGKPPRIKDGTLRPNFG